MLIMLAVGIPLYICATASTPIAAALILKGVSPGAALVFLLAGPDDAATSRANIIVWAFCMAMVFIGTHVVLGNVIWAEAVPALALGVFYTLVSAVGTYAFRRSGEERYRRFVLWLLVVLAVTGIVT